MIGHFPPGVVGGAELQAEAWARRLSDRHRVTVVTRRDPRSQPPHEARDGFEVVRLPVSRIPVWRALSDVRATERTVAGLGTRPDLLLCFQTFVSGLAGVRIQDRLGIPAVVWLRGEDEFRLEGPGLARWIHPAVWRRARGILVQSASIRDRVLREFERVSRRSRAELSGKLEVVPNGVDLPPPPFVAGQGVLSVGRLIRLKGVDTLIEALVGLDPWTSLGSPVKPCATLVVAGDGPERSRLEARARGHGLDVRFEGMASRGRLGELYREAGCVVLAARGGEGLPNVLIEAMSFARPVIATPISGVADLVQDGVNGLLVPPDDPRALRRALLRLQQETGLAAQLGAAARRTAEGYAWGSVRPRLEAVLERWSAP